VHCTRTTVGEATVIVCGRGRERPRPCCRCSNASTRLCDWVIGKTDKRVQRCSAPICDEHSTSPAPGKDLCPPHAAVWATHPNNPHRGDQSNT
jgi:hypothetical protein